VPIYDRDYYRREEPRPFLSAPRSMVAAIIIVNVALWIADFFTPETGAGRWLSDHLAVHVDTITRPWMWWQFVTYGFAHSPLNFQHILFNMLALFFLGPPVERAYGPKEFLRVYLAMVVFAGIVWSGVNAMYGTAGLAQAYGASAAVTGVVVLFALNFPRETILLFFVLPIPAWAFGVLIVVMNLYGEMFDPTSHIAYSMHLAGAAFAFVYYRRQWNFGRLTESLHLSQFSFRRQPRLRVHQPEEEPEAESDLNREVDRILEKISRQGEASLTAKERKTLETASREYQRKRRQ
jgi:membrane associated rhomboid family serine protease